MKPAPKINSYNFKAYVLYFYDVIYLSLYYELQNVCSGWSRPRPQWSR